MNNEFQSLGCSFLTEHMLFSRSEIQFPAPTREKEKKGKERKRDRKRKRKKKIVRE